MNLLHNLLTCIDLDPLQPLELSHSSPSPQRTISNEPIAPQQQRPKAKQKTSIKPLYNWNKVEQRKYINFLIRNRSLFDLSHEQRKCVKINVIMEKAIHTRSAAQCHTHHQKMMLKFGSIEEIIKAHAHLANKYTVPKKMRQLVGLPSNQNQSRGNSRQQYINVPAINLQLSDQHGMLQIDFLGDSQPDLSFFPGVDYRSFI